MRADLKDLNLSFVELAKISGERWQAAPLDSKETHEAEAELAKEQYHKSLAEYRKTEHYAQYQAYLADFRAKHPRSSSGESCDTSIASKVFVMLIPPASKHPKADAEVDGEADDPHGYKDIEDASMSDSTSKGDARRQGRAIATPAPKSPALRSHMSTSSGARSVSPSTQSARSPLGTFTMRTPTQTKWFAQPSIATLNVNPGVPAPCLQPPSTTTGPPTSLTGAYSFADSSLPKRGGNTYPSIGNAHPNSNFNLPSIHTRPVWDMQPPSLSNDDTVVSDESVRTVSSNGTSSSFDHIVALPNSAPSQRLLPRPFSRWSSSSLSIALEKPEPSPPATNVHERRGSASSMDVLVQAAESLRRIGSHDY